MRTIVYLPEGTFQLKRKFFGRGSAASACELCCLRHEDYCSFCADCHDFDTEKSAVYLQPLKAAYYFKKSPAQPLIRLNTPSEARREAADK